jgi:hypothetical protein
VHSHAAGLAHLIWVRFRVEFHPDYLREWMSKRDLSPQEPARRAKERDLREEGRWLTEDWPATQKG